MVDLPVKISIPTPSEIPRGRGRNATGRTGYTLKLRVTREERLLIDKIVPMIDQEMTVSSFLRWCGVQAALAIQRELEKSDAAQRDERADGGADGP
jgi:hypothetical protein